MNADRDRRTGNWIITAALVINVIVVLMTNALWPLPVILVMALYLVVVGRVLAPAGHSPKNS
jgi:hypothetical protein